MLAFGFNLSALPLHELNYDGALMIADELELDPHDINHARTIIIEARNRAGSLYSPDAPATEHTAGSFFKNPLVSVEQARELAQFDETGKTLDRIENGSCSFSGRLSKRTKLGKCSFAPKACSENRDSARRNSHGGF